MAPMFIIMSFAFGLAFFILILMASYKWSERPLGDAIVNRLGNLLGVFVAAVMYFVAVKHLAIQHGYSCQSHSVHDAL
jgi:molybdopterin-containing oxidoreductase family membrane subunit